VIEEQKGGAAGSDKSGRQSAEKRYARPRRGSAKQGESWKAKAKNRVIVKWKNGKPAPQNGSLWKLPKVSKRQLRSPRAEGRRDGRKKPWTAPEERETAGRFEAEKTREACPRSQDKREKSTGEQRRKKEDQNKAPEGGARRARRLPGGAGRSRQKKEGTKKVG